MQIYIKLQFFKILGFKLHKSFLKSFSFNLFQILKHLHCDLINKDHYLNILTKFALDLKALYKII